MEQSAIFSKWVMKNIDEKYEKFPTRLYHLNVGFNLNCNMSYN